MRKNPSPYVFILISFLLIGCQRAVVALASQKRQAVDQGQLKEIIRDYLNRNVGYIGFGGKVFSAYQVLGKEEAGDTIKEYVWVLCQEYYLSNGQAKLGTGVMLPVALTIRRQENDYRVISHRAPRDGNLYLTDIREIFPKDVQGDLVAKDAVSYNQRSEQLQREVEQEAKAYYKTR